MVPREKNNINYYSSQLARSCRSEHNALKIFQNHYLQQQHESLYTYKYIVYVFSDALLHDSTPQDQSKIHSFT